MKKILSYMRRAIDDYNMIDENDKIVVGISGGKDSLTLLMGLKSLQHFYPKKFDIHALTLDMGFENFDITPIKEMCNKLDIPYSVIKTNIKTIVFDIRKEPNPCSLCTKMRKGALHNEAIKLGYRKVALGHHMEDAIETFFMSLFFEGRFDCFAPLTYLDRKQITLIRPMVYLPEQVVKGFAKNNDIPIIENPCPEDGHTKREYIKQVINNLSKENKGLKKKIFNALKESKIEGW